MSECVSNSTCRSFASTQILLRRGVQLLLMCSEPAVGQWLCSEEVSQQDRKRRPPADGGQVPKMSGKGKQEKIFFEKTERYTPFSDFKMRCLCKFAPWMRDVMGPGRVEAADFPLVFGRGVSRFMDHLPATQLIRKALVLGASELMSQ